jgi:ABC-type multidrug transport system ATPase subunit
MLVEMDLEGYREAKAGRLSNWLALWFTEPTLLLLDEPSADLDPDHRQRIWDLLYKVTQSGATVFVTAHYMDESERCTNVRLSSGAV